MKQVLEHSKKVFLMVALLATVMGYANEPSYFIMNNKAGGTVLTLKSVKEGNYLTIKGDNGITLYKESIQKSGLYQKGFDLTSLPDGDYFFELDKDLEIRTIPFTITNTVVSFKRDEEHITFKPYVRVEGSKLYVSKLALNLESLEVNIYYNGKNADSDFTTLISSEDLKGSQTLERVYKLDKKQKGHYKVVLSGEGHTYTKNFDI